MTPGPDSETFGQRVRRLRRERGLSQRALAARVRIDNTYLSKLENDQPGQSPGAGLVRRLARALADDAEELLVLAGNVPIEDLRSRAREDAGFARSLRRLPAIPDARIAELVTPPAEMAAIEDFHSTVTFTVEGTGDDQDEEGAAPRRVVSRYESHFQGRQDEYLIGVVSESAHQDLLRDRDVPLHDILVSGRLPQGVEGTAEIVRSLQLSVGYRDEGRGTYEEVDLERLDELSELWAPRLGDSRVPLAVLRARFPKRRSRRAHRIVYRYSLALPSDYWVWYWKAARPTFLASITIDARDLSRFSECYVADFLPAHAPSPEEPRGFWTLHVGNWVVQGHGVALTWAPLTRSRQRGLPRTSPP